MQRNYVLLYSPLWINLQNQLYVCHVEGEEYPDFESDFNATMEELQGPNDAPKSHGHPREQNALGPTHMAPSAEHKTEESNSGASEAAAADFDASTPGSEPRDRAHS